MTPVGDLNSRHPASAAWTFIAAALAFCAGVLFTLSFVQPGTERSWFYDYQTLVAGFLAIAAAGITIWQMRVSDERFEKRHNDLLQLQLRPTRLLIERMIDPTISELEAFLRRIEKHLSDKRVEDFKVMDVYRLADWVNDAQKLANEIKTLLDRPQMDEARNVMSPQLYRALQLVLEIHDELAHRQPAICAELQNAGSMGAPAADAARPKFSEQVERVRQLHSSLSKMCDEAYALAASYGVQRASSPSPDRS